MRTTPTVETNSQYYGRLAKQAAASAAHVLVEGAGKPLGLFTAVAYLTSKNNIKFSSSSFKYLLGFYGFQMFAGLYNQFNYAARTSVDALEIEHQKRSEFEKIWRENNNNAEIEYTVTPALRAELAYLLAMNSVTELCDSMGAIFALMLGDKDQSTLSDEQKALYIAGGVLGGLVQASQSNIVVLRRGWENRAADLAIRKNILVPPVEVIFPWLKTYNHGFANVMPIVTPLMFGVLHVMAVKQTDLLHPLFQKLEGSASGLLFYPIALLLFMVTMAGTNHYDVRKAGQDLGYENRLAEEYRISKWLDKKLFCRAEPGSVDEPFLAARSGSDLDGATPSCGQELKAWTKNLLTHPCESAARLFYGDSLRSALKHIPLVKKAPEATLSGIFYVGIFYLFYLALNKNNNEVVETWLGAGKTAAWQDASWYARPEAIFTAVALFAAVAQTMQKYHAFKLANDRDANPDATVSDIAAAPASPA